MDGLEITTADRPAVSLGKYNGLCCNGFSVWQPELA